MFSVAQGIIFLGAESESMFSHACLLVGLAQPNDAPRSRNRGTQPYTVPRSPDAPSARSNVSFVSVYEVGLGAVNAR